MNLKKSAILGLGVSGKAVLRYLLQKGIKPLLFDKNSEALKNEEDLLTLPIHREEGASLDSIEYLIVSPGVPKEHPLLKEARERKIRITSEIEIALESLLEEPVKLFAITGSCGKTTTTSLVTHLLTAAGKRAKSYGNIGYPLINYWLEKTEYLVVELSSYQLEMLQQERAIFDAALILNITPNHLDHHATMEEYVKAKMHLGHLLKKGAPLYITEKIKEQFGHYLHPNVTTSFFDKEKVATIFLTSYRDRRFGEFVGDVENSQAAYALCREINLSEKLFGEYAKSFKKPEHRFEFVDIVKDVTYINDSKATTVMSVIEAVKALSAPVILIAGGVDKGMDFSPWKEAFNGKVSLVLLIGKASSMLATLLDSHLLVQEVGTLEHAVERASSVAKKGEYVLLSPGCASFDQFVDYQQRGKRFKELVLKVKEAV